MNPAGHSDGEFRQHLALGQERSTSGWQARLARRRQVKGASMEMSCWKRMEGESSWGGGQGGGQGDGPGWL